MVKKGKSKKTHTVSTSPAKDKDVTLSEKEEVEQVEYIKSKKRTPSTFIASSSSSNSPKLNNGMLT